MCSSFEGAQTAAVAFGALVSSTLLNAVGYHSSVIVRGPAVRAVEELPIVEIGGAAPGSTQLLQKLKVSVALWSEFVSSVKMMQGGKQNGCLMLKKRSFVDGGVSWRVKSEIVSHVREVPFLSVSPNLFPSFDRVHDHLHKRECVFVICLRPFRDLGLSQFCAKGHSYQSLYLHDDGVSVRVVMPAHAYHGVQHD